MRGCPREGPRCTGIEHDEAHEYEAYEWPSRAIKGNQGHVPARGSERTVEMAAPHRGVPDVASHRLGRARAILVAWLYGGRALADYAHSGAVALRDREERSAFLKVG